MIYDVAVVGCGPSGMAAAVKLKNFGLSVLLVDEQPAPGGQIWRGIERNASIMSSASLSALGADYQAGMSSVREFRAANVDYLPSTQVWQIEGDWTLFLTSAGRARRISARAVLLATGAQERPAPFAGWTLPGVMTVGAAQILMKSGDMLPKGRIWIAGSGPLPLLYATQLLKRGKSISGYLDTSPGLDFSAIGKLVGGWRNVPQLIKGIGWQWGMRRKNLLHWKVQGLAAQGNERLEHISWMENSELKSAAADVLLVHEGVVPRIHETLALGCEHRWNDAQRYLAPALSKMRETSRIGLFVAGDAGGIGGWVAAEASGEIAAIGIAARLGAISDVDGIIRQAHLRQRQARALALRPFLDAVYPPPRHDIEGDVMVCRCEEVTASTVKTAADYSGPDMNAVKAATRCGMGPCQGRQCGYTVQSIISKASGQSPEKLGFYNIRPPFKPVTLGELALMEAGNMPN